jgi:hypothetical protein
MSIPLAHTSLQDLKPGYKYRAPEYLYPEFFRFCAERERYLLEAWYAVYTKRAGNLSDSDVAHYRRYFKLQALRFGLWPGVHYSTRVVGNQLLVIWHQHQSGLSPTQCLNPTILAGTSHEKLVHNLIAGHGAVGKMLARVS